jgi:2',3'-cyclic-nucleotide 2'-phosphodiesterase (5'-nucleotidase family)
LQWGRGALERMLASVHFPVLAANLVDCSDPARHEATRLPPWRRATGMALARHEAARLAVPGLKASHVFELDSHKLGLVGATAVFRDGYDRFGYRSLDPIPILQQEVAALKAQAVKTIILLSHIGSWLHDPATKKPEILNDEDLPSVIPELDVIVGAHTHITLDPPVRVGQAVIAQAGDYGRWLGRLDLDLDDDTGRVRAFSGKLVPCGDGVPPDPTISATLEFVREEAARLLDTVLAQAVADLPHHFDQPSPFASRVADALRDTCKADLAILFSGFAHSGLQAGPITRRNLYQAIPGSAHVTAAEVSGAQIQRMLERMLASKYRTESFEPKRNSPPLGLPACSSNVQLEYDLSGNQLTRCLIDQSPLDPGRHYRLASTYTTLNPITDDPEYDFIGVQPGQVVENVRVEEVLWEIVEAWVKLKGRV